VHGIAGNKEKKEGENQGIAVVGGVTEEELGLEVS